MSWRGGKKICTVFLPTSTWTATGSSTNKEWYGCPQSQSETFLSTTRVTRRSKGERKKSDCRDVRLTLLGNTWSVPVVAWLLNQLLNELGIAVHLSPQAIIARCAPGAAESVQGRLVRLPLKSEDILLTTPTSQLVKFHRLRASVPSKLWRWRVVSGWKWTTGKEHINSLELRAILNALRWRLELAGAGCCT